MRNIYQIRPLKWKNNGNQSYSAWTPFGSYEVNKWDGQWAWSYCFDEYYDEEQSDCATLKEGKRAAEEHWRERISTALKTLRPLAA